MKALQGYRFADTESRRNAERALNPDRPMAFVITGPTGAGKSRLAKQILKPLLGVCSPGPQCPGSASELRSALNLAADLGSLFLEDVPKRVLASDDLQTFLTLDRWLFRRRGKQDLTIVVNNCLTVITCPEHVEIPEYLLRSVRVIRLTQRG